MVSLYAASIVQLINGLFDNVLTHIVHEPDRRLGARYINIVYGCQKASSSQLTIYDWVMISSHRLTHILLLTGTPGIGKTTLIRRVAAQLAEYRLGGFFTEEIREAGQRQGFRLVTFNGEAGIMAHVNFDHRYRISKYGVDVSAIDHFAESALALVDEVDVYLIDEIGKMECFSSIFVTNVKALLNSSKPVVATVAKKGTGLIEAAKRWSGSELWELTKLNRDARVTEVIKWLEAYYSTHT